MLITCVLRQLHVDIRSVSHKNRVQYIQNPFWFEHCCWRMWHVRLLLRRQKLGWSSLFWLFAVASTTATTTSSSRQTGNPQLLTRNLGFRKRPACLLERTLISSPPLLSTKSSLLILRGGASTASKAKRLNKTKTKGTTTSTSTETTSSTTSVGSSSPVVLKLRKIIRSLLESTHSTGALHLFIKTLASWLEAILGTQLLPIPKPRKHKTRKATATTQKTKTKKAKAKAKVTSTKKSAGTSKHMPTKSASTNSNYRIQRELQAFLQDPPEHLAVKVGKNIRVWIVTLDGLGIYQGESFQLRISFPSNYPMRPPSVYFLPPHIPVHEHVYSNGDICLSLLGKDWRPTMTAQSIAHSILSILASASRKSKPKDNAQHAHNKPGEYQEAWVYHDDSC